MNSDGGGGGDGDGGGGDGDGEGYEKRTTPDGSALCLACTSDKAALHSFTRQFAVQDAIS